MNVSINSTLADALFGSNTSTSSNSILSASSLGDWGLMKSGVYTRMLRSYYDKTNESSSSDSANKTTTDNTFTNLSKDKLDKLQSTASDKTLSTIKSAASTLNKEAKTVSSDNYDDSTREDIYSNVKKFADAYNSMIVSAGKTDLTSIGQSTKWMVNDTKAHEDQLADVGITIGTDNKLSINEDKFSKASISDIKSLFDGNSSYAGKMSQRASGYYNLASNQIAFNSGKTLYSSTGTLM